MTTPFWDRPKRRYWWIVRQEIRVSDTEKETTTWKFRHRFQAKIMLYLLWWIGDFNSLSMSFRCASLRRNSHDDKRLNRPPQNRPFRPPIPLLKYLA